MEGNSSVDAWTNFCESIKATGVSLLNDSYPNSTDRDQAEGVRHLSRLSMLALHLYIEASDINFPRFVRFNDDVTQWGGNNVDNDYLIANIDESGTYKIYGNVSECPGFILSVRDGYMHLGEFGVEDISSKDIDIDEEGNFEIIVSSIPHEGNYISMVPNATQISIRVYYYDWVRDAQPTFHIVRLDNDNIYPDTLSSTRIVAGLADASKWIESNLEFWNNWLKERGPFLPVNGISEPQHVPGGSNEVITYSGGRYEIQSHQALVITMDPIKAEYLGFVHYTDGWFETADMSHRISGLNQSQLAVDSDNKIRIVVCSIDPGVQNWMDIEGRNQGLLSLRTINGDAPPNTRSHLIDIKDLKNHLPKSTKWFGAEERKRQIAERREGIARRFHR